MTENQYLKGLLDLRSKLAFETKGNHSWSFSDEELKRLLKAEPRTLDELGQIKGFPRKGKRVSAYGQSIIDIFNGKSIKGFDVKVNGEDDIVVETIMQPLSSFAQYLK